LDPICLPHPGWWFDVEMNIMGTHVVNRVGQSDPPIAGVTNVPMATLNWAASPRFEAGYRLPSGFGEIGISYRFLLTEGLGLSPMGATASPDAPATLESHLDMNIGDVDYGSTETSLGPNWLMKWRLGLRTADVLFTSQADEPFAAAAGGSGIFQRGIENNFCGIGPHGGVELRSRSSSWGIEWVGKLDSGLLFGRVHQRFNQALTAGPGTEVDFKNWQQVPMLSGLMGLDWRLPNHPNVDVLLGYTAEYWWNVGRLSDPPIYDSQSAGEVGAQGAVLRLEYNY
jgi:hypothetical protein